MRLHIALDIYVMQGEVLETVMLGGTSDISQFYYHGFYDWVMFRDDPIQYPDEIQWKSDIWGRQLMFARQ